MALALGDTHDEGSDVFTCSVSENCGKETIGFYKKIEDKSLDK